MLNKVITIAKEAGNILLKYHNKNLKIQTKSNAYDFVTQADKESDQFIRNNLQKQFPNCKILSEENNKRPENYSGKVWMVDPLDATKDFINGGTGFSVMIGLCVDGEPVLGIVYAPKRNELYYAQKGKGAYFMKEGKELKLTVNNIKEISQAKLITRIPYGEKRNTDALLEQLPVLKTIPEASVGLKLGLIAKGEAETHINSNFRASKWDTCAPQVILEEAGGIITDLEGNKLDYKQDAVKWEKAFVASNNLVLHQQIVNRLKEIYFLKMP